MKRRRRFLAFSMMTAMALTTAAPSLVYAAPRGENLEQNENAYSLVWEDDFEGDSLNRSNWNVELHEKGWVNNELQEYVDSSDNISVHGGNLYITPIKSVKTVEKTDVGNMLNNADFSAGMDSWSIYKADWNGVVCTSSTSNNSISFDIENGGSADWNIKLSQSGINLVKDHHYEIAFDITSTVSRKFKNGVMNESNAWYGGGEPELEANTEKHISQEFTMDKDDSDAYLYISLGVPEADMDQYDPHTVTISNISLVDMTADNADEETTKEVTSYTSGRISTQNKKTFTYGRFEARAKVPEGQGFLPAFWLMANDENIYGQWPRCGEIDCMEVMGQDPAKVYGTIHYGNPHSESQNTKTLSGGDSFANDFHTFACEWEPGSIKWFVDGELYHEEHDWHSTTEGQGTLSYPAPFDQPFYIILNLAVGGSWVGNPNASTFDDNNDFVIDYVRVYQKDEYDENVTRPEKIVNLREPNADGNYINNGDFSIDENLSDDTDWKFLTALEGDAAANIADNEILITTENEGTVDYSVQLVQANVPFEKGATYKVSFDAYASSNREMGVDIKAPDYGYKSYMPHQTAQLTTEKKTFTYTFKMKDSSDANGRLEYNMGATGSTADIHISNVSVVKTAEADPNEQEVKTVLSNGNYVYNGSFQEGDKHLGYWTVGNESAANVSVTGFADGRRLKVEMNDNANKAVTLTQEDLAFTSGSPYAFSFAASSDVDNTIEATVGGVSFTANLAAGENKTYKFVIPSDIDFANHNISFKFGKTGTTYLDDIKLVENAMIKNGSFNDGTTGYNIYIDSSAKASYVVDSLKEDNALSVTVNNTNDSDWKIQIKQENVTLEKGKTYKLSFKAKSTLARKIRAIMQGTEARGWDVYSSDNIVDLTSSYQTFTDTFTMEKDTDEAAFLSICLGKIDEQISTLHTVCIDDIILEEVTGDGNLDDTENNETVIVPIAPNTPGSSGSATSSHNAASLSATSSNKSQLALANEAADPEAEIEEIEVQEAIEELPTMKILDSSIKTASSDSDSSEASSNIEETSAESIEETVTESDEESEVVADTSADETATAVTTEKKEPISPVVPVAAGTAAVAAGGAGASFFFRRRSLRLKK